MFAVCLLKPCLLCLSPGGQQDLDSSCFESSLPASSKVSQTCSPQKRQRKKKNQREEEKEESRQPVRFSFIKPQSVHVLKKNGTNLTSPPPLSLSLPPPLCSPRSSIPSLPPSKQQQPKLQGQVGEQGHVTTPALRRSPLPTPPAFAALRLAPARSILLPARGPSCRINRADAGFIILASRAAGRFLLSLELLATPTVCLRPLGN